MGEIKPYVKDDKIPGSLIRQICIAYRISQIELAKRIGCYPGMIYMWISGKRIPSPGFNGHLWDLWNNAPKNAPEMITSDEIYNFRRALGMTQTQFAQKFGVNVLAVSRWEIGRSRPPLRKSDEIRAAYREFQNTATEGDKNDQQGR